MSEDFHPVAYLRKYGWCQGQLRNSKNEVCAIGAVYGSDSSYVAQRDPELDDRITEALLEAHGVSYEEACLRGWAYNLSPFADRPRLSVSRINDDPRTTQAIVDQALVKVFGEPLDED